MPKVVRKGSESHEHYEGYEKAGDCIGMSEHDFDARDLLKKYSNSMNVESKSTGAISKSWDVKIGKVKVIGS